MMEDAVSVSPKIQSPAIKASESSDRGAPDFNPLPGSGTQERKLKSQRQNAGRKIRATQAIATACATPQRYVAWPPTNGYRTKSEIWFHPPGPRLIPSVLPR